MDHDFAYVIYILQPHRKDAKGGIAERYNGIK